MFENLSPREKKLALIVGSLAPLFVVFLGGKFFLDSYNSKKQEIQNLTAQMDTEQERALAGLTAGDRRVYYKSVSLPSNNAKGFRDDYKQWVLDLAKDTVGMSNTKISPDPMRPVNYVGQRKQEHVFDSFPFTLTAQANLDQVAHFLFEFYKLDLLHRVNSINLVPKSVGKNGADTKTRSGLISVTVKFETIALVDAPREGDWKRFKKPEHDLKFYREQIVGRNIFGPANNPPILEIRDMKFTEGGRMSRSISARETDRNDRVTFELVSKIHGAELKQTSATSKSARFEIKETLPVGEYGPFIVNVTDSGFPAKTTTAEFMVKIEPKKIVKRDPEPPPFKHVGQSRIRAVTRNVEGAWEVWIIVETEGKKYKLVKGEKFVLDQQDWFIHDITSRDNVVIKVDNQLLTFKSGSRLTSPLKTQDLGQVSTGTVQK